MLEPTKVHQDLLGDKLDKHSIRIGTTVPDGAVNLAYFHNNKTQAEANILIADAPKQTVDHMVAQQFLEESECHEQNDDIFPEHILYQDEQGYIGYLERDNVAWESQTSSDTISKEVSGTQEVSVKEVAQMISHEEAGYSGTLYLQDVSFTEIEHVTEQKNSIAYKDVKRKMTIEGLTTPSTTWPDLYQASDGTTEVEVDGYSGTLEKVAGQEKYIKITSQTIGRPVVKTKTVNKLEKLPNTFIENGVVYTLKEVEQYRGSGKYYGVTRYYGNFYGTDDPNGVYGEAIPGGCPYYSENTYVTDRHGNIIEGRGHFADTHPRIPKGIWRGSRLESLLTKVSDDEFNLPDRDSLTYEYGVRDEFWMLDTSYSPTGHVWADEWVKSHAFPPKGYTCSDEGTPIALNQDDTPHLDYLNVGAFNDEHGRKAYYVPTSDRDYNRPENGKSWYRDVISFYKADVVTIKGYYVGHTPDGSVNTWRGEQMYQGILSKTVTESVRKPVKWSANYRYAGELSNHYTTYSGSAFYKGLVAKQLTAGNIEPTFESEFLMAPDENGILTTATQKQTLGSDRFFVASEFKNGTPLYYEGRLVYPFYYPNEVSEFEYYHGDNIKLVNSSFKALSRTHQYQIKLKPYDIERHLYWVYIYTNFQITNKNKVFAIYNAYDDKDGSLNRIKINHNEPVHVQPYLIQKKDYKVIQSPNDAGMNLIEITDGRRLLDERKRRRISYQVVIEADGFHYYSDECEVMALNRAYAFPQEEKWFIGNRMIVSQQRNGKFLSPYDMVILANPSLDDEEIEDIKNQSTCFVEILDYGETDGDFDPVIALSVNPDGSGYVLMDCTEDTGFYNESSGKYDKKIPVECEYIIRNGYIVPAYKVKCLDIQSIKLNQPRETKALENWYPRVANGRYTHVKDVNGTRTKLTYSLPEFEQGFYSDTYGRPYVDVKGETPSVTGESTLTTKYAPLLVLRDDNYQPDNLSVYKLDADGNKRHLSISHWSYSDGVITLNDIVSENDNILVDYTYEESTCTYRGYRQDDVFIDLDLNPNQYHTFLDTRTEPYRRQPVYELFNSIVYFFVKPSSIQVLDFDGEPIPNKTIKNDSVIYHRFNNTQPFDQETDLLIGSIYVRHNTSFKSTTLVDTRQCGGGILKQISDDLRRQLEPESDYYWDIAHWDGTPYNENGVVIIRLDKRLLKENGGQFTDQEIQEAVQKWVAIGVLPIVEYVTTLSPDELPQQTLEVETVSVAPQTKRRTKKKINTRI